MYLSACGEGGRGKEGDEVSHMLVMDDILIFCKASQDRTTFLH